MAVRRVLWARLSERAIIRRHYAVLREYHRYHEIDGTYVLRLFATATLIQRERIPAPEISDQFDREIKERTVSAL